MFGAWRSEWWGKVSVQRREGGAIVQAKCGRCGRRPRRRTAVGRMSKVRRWDRHRMFDEEGSERVGGSEVAEDELVGALTLVVPSI